MTTPTRTPLTAESEALVLSRDDQSSAGWFRQRLAAIEAAAATAERERVAAVVGRLVFGDLREDFEDGQDIVLRWKGNKADWEAVRAILEPAP